MKLARFRAGDQPPHLGVVLEDEIADITAVEPSLTADTLWRSRQEEGTIRSALRRAPRMSTQAARLLPPVSRPGKFLAIGLNYRSHIDEAGLHPPKHQMWFNKQSTCVIGHQDPIYVPKVSKMVDYEGELAFVIGQRCRHVPANKAIDVIAGYTVCNDVSVRDWQRHSTTMTMGKSFDSHGPLGPVLAIDKGLADGAALRVQTFVNGELRQDGNTDDLIFGVCEMIAYLSMAFTLEPGDVMTTGTPAGTGSNHHPPVWLTDGDTVSVEVEGIGTLQNPVLDERSTEEKG